MHHDRFMSTPLLWLYIISCVLLVQVVYLPFFFLKKHNFQTSCINGEIHCSSKGVDRDWKKSRCWRDNKATILLCTHSTSTTRYCSCWLKDNRYWLNIIHSITLIMWRNENWLRRQKVIQLHVQWLLVVLKLASSCSLIDLELANPNILPPILPAHKITTGDIVGLDVYKKDKPSKNVDKWSGVVARVTESRITVALSQEIEDELPAELQERCQM